jgi:thioredoxin reductase
MKQQTTILIIGAGPAGITTAIQLQRYALPYIIVEKGPIGGLLWNANLVENYPGFPGVLSGPKLINLFEKQLKRFNVSIRKDEITSVEWKGDNYSIRGRVRYTSKILVIASGTKPKQFPIMIPNAARKRVFSNVVPLLDVRNKTILIVGAGDAAFDYALNMTKNRNSVTILNRGKQVKCLGLLKKRADADPRILYRTNLSVARIISDQNGGRLKVWCDSGESLDADYLIFAIGRDPQLDFLTNSIRENEKILRAHGRLYFIGDVCNGLLRQTAIATGDGLRAAMQIYQNFKEGTL